jgi:hypothetical protein
MSRDPEFWARYSGVPAPKPLDISPGAFTPDPAPTVCTHPRAPQPTNRATALPCAWPTCPDGVPGVKLVIYDGLGCEYLYHRRVFREAYLVWWEWEPLTPARDIDATRDASTP